MDLGSTLLTAVRNTEIRGGALCVGSNARAVSYLTKSLIVASRVCVADASEFLGILTG
jgi:hypothetical protein